MPQAEEPRKHHFAPVFYLSRWAGADGCIEQFTTPFGAEVKARRMPPSATGFKPDLYAMPGLPDHLVQQVEKGFMQQLDDRAAKVLAKMEEGQEPTGSTERSDWTRFIQSLQLRTPADIASLKIRTRLDWDVTSASVQNEYDALRRDGDPPTFEAYIEARDPLIVEQAAMRIATRLIDHPAIGVRINEMNWDIVDLSKSNLDLLTSDHAVERTLGLGDPRAFITLPVGPTRLFIAANRRTTIDALRRVNQRDLVALRNRLTAATARDYAWAADRRQLGFVQRYFRTVTVPTLGEALAKSASAA